MASRSRIRGLVLLAAFAIAPLVRGRHMRWGATPGEFEASLPGDDLVHDAVTSTRAITINAPPSDIWPWLVQMGQDRAGFYSYDWLERLAGAGIHNANRIVEEWQHLAPGDLMRTYRYIARFEPLGWIVEAVEPERALVVMNMKRTWSWSLSLHPSDEVATRLVARTRAARRHGISRVTEWLISEPLHFIMETGVLHGIQERAEALSAERPVE